MSNDPPSELANGRLRALGQRFQARKPDYYYDHYERHMPLDPNGVTSVLELGVHRGGSLLMWMEYFPNAQIFGVDLLAYELDPELHRIHVLRADQTNVEKIGQFIRSHGVTSLDLIVDDCSHLGMPTKISFAYLFETFLKPGGYYVIEDWGTGYKAEWPDGAPLDLTPDFPQEQREIFKSHNHGIPGVVKQLIDLRMKFESIVLTSAFALFRKQTEENEAALERTARAGLLERQQAGSNGPGTDSAPAENLADHLRAVVGAGLFDEVLEVILGRSRKRMCSCSAISLSWSPSSTNARTCTSRGEIRKRPAASVNECSSWSGSEEKHR